MSILINKDTKIIVQGLTGKTGTFHTEQALAYHNTQMVAGTHPKKGGQEWTSSDGRNLPLYSSVAEAKDATGAKHRSFTFRQVVPRQRLKKPSMPALN